MGLSIEIWLKIVPLKTWKRGPCTKNGVEAGSPPRQDNMEAGEWGRGPGHGGDPLSERACILHQIYKRGNEVFTLISCQVFPLEDCWKPALTKPLSRKSGIYIARVVFEVQMRQLAYFGAGVVLLGTGFGTRLLVGAQAS